MIHSVTTVTWPLIKSTFLDKKQIIWHYKKIQSTSGVHRMNFEPFWCWSFNFTIYTLCLTCLIMPYYDKHLHKCLILERAPSIVIWFWFLSIVSPVSSNHKELIQLPSRTEETLAYRKIHSLCWGWEKFVLVSQKTTCAATKVLSFERNEIWQNVHSKLEVSLMYQFRHGHLLHRQYW